MASIYEPEEDSYLISSCLKKKIPVLLAKNTGLRFLEIGAGSGIQLSTALESGVKKKDIFSCDVNPDSVQHCKKLGFNCIKSDLFEKLTGKFDIIVFNPPYLPEDCHEPQDSKTATTGGKFGSEIINEFIKQSKKHLNKNGRIFLITSSLTKGIKWQGYKKKILVRKKFFFEELYCWELTK